MRVDGGKWEDIDTTLDENGQPKKVPYTLEITPTEIIFIGGVTGKVTKINRQEIGVGATLSHDSKALTFKNTQGKVDLDIIPFSTGIRFIGDMKDKVRQELSKQLGG